MMQNNPDPVVFLVDDDAAVRDALGTLIETAGFQVEKFDCAEEFLSAYAPGRSGCLVADIRMPGMSGLDLQETLNAKGIQIPIIFITGHGDVPMSAKAFRAGAMDFIEKPVDDSQLVNRIQEALALDGKQHEEVLRKQEIWARYNRLTVREKEVMALVVESKSSKQIARELGISHRTIDTHRARIMEKMQVKSLGELIMIAVECGLK